MNAIALLLMLAGTGLIAQGVAEIPRGTVPRNLARERAQSRRRRAGLWMIGVGVALLVVAIAVGRTS